MRLLEGATSVGGELLLATLSSGERVEKWRACTGSLGSVRLLVVVLVPVLVPSDSCGCSGCCVFGTYRITGFVSLVGTAKIFRVACSCGVGGVLAFLLSSLLFGVSCGWLIGWRAEFTLIVEWAVLSVLAPKWIHVLDSSGIITVEKAPTEICVAEKWSSVFPARKIEMKAWSCALTLQYKTWMKDTLSTCGNIAKKTIRSSHYSHNHISTFSISGETWNIKNPAVTHQNQPNKPKLHQQNQNHQLFQKPPSFIYFQQHVWLRD